MKSKTGKVIVFLIILVSLLLVFTPVANAQTPTPPTRDSLIQAIQQRAQKDVELGAAPQSPTDLAVLFGEQATVVGMSMSEVKDIYDEAYKVATPIKSPWDDLLKPQGGWIFLIIGILLTILAGIAKDYLTAFFKKLAEAAYQRLARFRPFWMIALRRYRKSLEATYRELKIPFRAGRPLQMQDVYVPVRVDGGDKQQVDAYKTIQKQKRLVVLGDPGSGKTMFLRHVAFTYARQGLYDFPGQPIPVYLELNRVEGVGNSLLDALTKTLENHNFPGAGGFIKSQLEKKSLLILLDGLDEVNAQARPALVSQIQDLWQKHPDNRIIVTCRKAVYQGELDTWVDGKLEIIEFSDQQIQRFMTSWQKDMPAEKSIEHFFRTLQERPQIMVLARNPLLLTMVAYLYTDTEFALPHSRSEFYSRSTDLLLDQWKLERNRYKASHKRTVLQRLALFNQSQAGKTGERRTLELADVLKEIREVLPDLTLKIEDAQPLLDEIAQRSGLMLAIDSGTRYQFTHLTLQEYFAARALETDQNKLLEFYRADPDAWREVVRLWCALEHDSTAMLKELYRLDPVMAFECLSDTQQVDNAYAEELIQSFQPRLHEALTSTSLASAFALLASDPRPRGKKWFEFVESNLTDESNRLAACTVLAGTNIPQAAEPLAKYAMTNSDVIPFLVQLGNLVVPSLTELAQSGEIWAMDALVEIGTPQAALALEPLLWTDDPQAYHSAWRLGALISLPGIEDALKTVVLSPEQLKAKQINWVWEPFTDNLSLRSITGRISYLFGSTPETEVPMISMPCDSRLALALCTVVKNVYQSLPENARNHLREQIEGEEKSLLPIDNLELTRPQLNEQKRKNIVDSFIDQLNNNPILQFAYSSLSMTVQFELLSKLALEKAHPSEYDWRNLGLPLSYNFSSSWHVKFMKLLIIVLGLLNLIGIGVQIVQSPILSLVNVVFALIGIVLIVSIVLAVKATWSGVDSLVGINIATMIVNCATLGAMLGDITGDWIMGSVIGAMVCAVVMMWGFAFPPRSGNTWAGAVFGILIGATLGAIGGVLGVKLGYVGGIVICLLVSAIFGVSLGRSIDLWTGVIALLFFPILVLLPTYFSTRLIYTQMGLLSTMIFWVLWSGGFSLLSFLAQYLQRRTQNPLQGLLESSGAVVSSKRSSSFFSRWFRL